MSDQADELRYLARHNAASAAPLRFPSPRIIAVAGGKGGVGTTTVAVNLAVALGVQGHRVVLADLQFDGGDVATHCDITPLASVEDVLAGRLTVHEALSLGPAGVQVLPGAWPKHTLVDPDDADLERLIWGLQGLGRHVDLVVLDVGAQVNRQSRRFWLAADEIVLVTTPDTVALMDAYATIKLMTDSPLTGTVHALVNMADEAAAESATGRLSRACQRFLNFDIATFAHLPPAATDLGDSSLGAVPLPYVLAEPDAAVARRLEMVATELVGASTAGPRNGAPAVVAAAAG
ncbi:MAG: P-loop NTPase [Planctomycetales bacterium]|nr:P-loop NTPase [Planctomycetales bacterium]